MNELLQYLNNNIGKPIFIEDFYQTFSSYDKRDLNNVINDLISKGFIYTFNNAFYLTKYGQDVLRDPSITNPYDKARQKGITYQNRDQFLNKWLKHFLGAVEVFRQNHPELKNLFDILGVKAEDSVTRFHDANEFVKDVQAIFNRFDFTTPELRYAPKEVDYNIPENLMSIEHAIAESLNRLMQYSPRHTSYITDPRKYREVYDKVDNFLSQEDIQSFLVKNLELRDGTFVKKDNVKSQLIQLYVKTNRGENLELVKISFEQLNNKVNNIIKSISPNLFFEGEDIGEASNRLYNLILERGGDIFDNFSSSASEPSRKNILGTLFSGSNFDNIDFSGCDLNNIVISGCSFIGGNFRLSKWEGSTVINNNFQGANFENTNFREISNFKDNNIEGANFENASLSPLIDKNVNIGEPLNLKSLVVTKEEMKEKGFRGKESFNHVGVSYDKKVPGYTLDAKGEDWVRYIYATQDTPFPKELFNKFKLHSSVPGDYSLGWIGGKWYDKTKTLYVTEMQSDLMQRTYELSTKWLQEHGYGGENHEFIKKGWDKLKSKLENYYDGWQYVFFNQAIREAKERGAKFIATPTAEYYHKKYSESPYQYYDQIVQQKVKDPETGEVKTEPKFPYREEGHWRFIKVDQITKWATLEKLSWKINPNKYEQMSDDALFDEESRLENLPDPNPDNEVARQDSLERIRKVLTMRGYEGKPKLSWKELIINKDIIYQEIEKAIEKGIQELRIEDPELPLTYEILQYGRSGLYEEVINEIDLIISATDFNNILKTFLIRKKLSSLKFSADEPSEAQIEAGNYKKDHIRKDGFDITIENKKGSTRSGTDPDGNEWSIKMKHDYGYIKGTVGKDKDHVDCILADNYKEGNPVFIVNQLNDKGNFDEHKCVMGAKDKEEAEKIYLDNYEKGWDQYEKDLVEMTIDEFKDWVMDKKETKKKADLLNLSWNELDTNKKYWVYNRDTGVFIREGTFEEISQLYKISPAFLKRSITQNIGIGGIYILDPNNYERKPLRIKNKLERESETKGKKIIGISIETGTEYPFNSVGEAAREIGVSRSAIFQALKRGGNAGGYKWKYVNSEITSNLKLSWEINNEEFTKIEVSKSLKKLYDEWMRYFENIDGANYMNECTSFINFLIKYKGFSEKRAWRLYKIWCEADEKFDKISSLQKLSLDEVYWKTYIEKYIETFIRTQERLEPGLGSKKELAKDGFKFMMDEIPEEVKRDPQFPQLITNLRESLIEKGIGDIFDNTPSYLDRTQKNDGDQLIDPEGNPIEETTNLERLNFEEPEEETEDVNTLLDQLSKAKEEGDQEKINEIKRKLDRIIGLSSLSFRKNSWKMFDFKVLKEDEVPWSMKAGGRRGQINTTYDKLLQVLGTPTRLSSPDDKIQAEWVIYFPEQDEYAWVYDYRESIPREEVTDWHVGGNSPNTVDLVKNILGLHTVERFNIGGSKKLSWNSGKGSYKNLRFDYNPDRGQQINEYEPAGGDSSALSPLEMQQIYDTDFFEPNTDKWDKENESLSDPTRDNLQFGM